MHVDHGDRGVGEDAADGGGGLERLELRHGGKPKRCPAAGTVARAFGAGWSVDLTFTRARDWLFKRLTRGVAAWQPERVVRVRFASRCDKDGHNGLRSAAFAADPPGAMTGFGSSRNLGAGVEFTRSRRHGATEVKLKLPTPHSLRVDREKIVEYLLNHEHPDGRAKALFFERVGFKTEAWETLADALRAHGGTHDVASVVESRFGTRYIVEGKLVSPDGRNPLIRTVWIVEKAQAAPRLVTAYPLEESR